MSSYKSEFSTAAAAAATTTRRRSSPYGVVVDGADEEKRANSGAAVPPPPQSSSSGVASFYDGRAVFVTGGSGFLGKALLEKLLRSCPGVGKVFVLIRDKRGKTGRDRVAELLRDDVFGRVREENPRAFDKVVPVCGDLSFYPDLGISDADKAALAAEVSVVFHSAASVKFDEPLRAAVQLNLAGTAAVLGLCKSIRNLAAVVYVSTAFSNCERTIVEEKIYPAPCDPDKVIDAATWLDADAMDLLYDKIKGDKVLTYVLTKALAETYVEKHGREWGLPVAVVRPSIVMNSVREPFPGWVGAAQGAGMGILAVAAGVWRYSNTDGAALANGIPVDLVVNLMLSVAWDVGRRRSTSSRERRGDDESLKVFNMDSGVVNPVTWNALSRAVLDAGRDKCCLENAAWYPSFNQDTSRLRFLVQTSLKELLPAHVSDLGTRLVGGRPRSVKTYRAVQSDSLRYFMMGNWQFQSQNVPSLQAAMTPEDRETFNFDVTGIAWDEYIVNCVYGFRTYLLKQDPATIPSSVKRMRRLKLLRLFLRFFLFWALALAVVSTAVLAAGTDFWN